MRADFSDRPVLIPAGTLGAQSDLVVSPQHRLLLNGPDAAGGEVLVPAKALIGQRGIRCMRGQRRIDWHHFALSRHELVRVNGVWTESLFLGPMVLGGMTAYQRLALRGLFAAVQGDALNGPPVRPFLSVRQARAMTGRRKMRGPRGVVRCHDPFAV